MPLPFTREEFFAVFGAYNQAVWPAQLVAYLLGLGLGMVLALLRPTRWTHRIVGAGLGLMRVWTGVAHHAMFFAPIKKAANAFAALFVAQGLLFAHAALLRFDLRFSGEHGPRAWLGWALIAHSAFLYPLIGVAPMATRRCRCSASRPVR